MRRWSGGRWVVAFTATLLSVHCGSSDKANGSGGGAGGSDDVPQGGTHLAGSAGAVTGGSSGATGGAGTSGKPVQAGDDGGGEIAGQGGMQAGGIGGAGSTAAGEAGTPSLIEGGSGSCEIPTTEPGSGEVLAFNVARDFATGSFYVGLPFDLVELDGNSYLDAVMAMQSGGKLALLRGTAEGTFQPATELVFPSVTSATAHDVNDDGVADLFLLQSGLAQNQALVALGNGDGSFQAAKPAFVRSGHGVPQFHDLVGDEHVDLIALRANWNDVVIYEGDGLGALHQRSRSRPAAHRRHSPWPTSTATSCWTSSSRRRQARAKPSKLPGPRRKAASSHSARKISPRFWAKPPRSLASST